MHCNFCRSLSLCSAFVLFAPVGAVASPTTFGFTGVVTSVGAELTGTFSVNQPFAGNISFESTTLDSMAGDPSEALYNNAITTFLATFAGGYTVTQGLDNDVRIANGPPGADVYDPAFLTNPTGAQVAGRNLALLYFALADTDATVLTSDALLLTPPALSNFELDTSVLVFGNGSNNQSVRLQLTSLTVVPEPTALVLAWFGLFSITCRRRRNLTTTPNA